MRFSATSLSVFLTVAGLASAEVQPQLSSRGFAFEDVAELEPETIEFINNVNKEAQASAHELQKQTFCRNSTQGQIFFWYPGQEFMEFVLGTPWRVTYPSRLVAALEAQGFVVFDKPENSCYWLSMGSVKSKAVYRGSFAYRHTTQQIDTMGDARDAGYPHPFYETSIRHALSNTYPLAEVWMILFFTLALPALTLLAGWLGKGLWQRRRGRGMKKMAGDDCLELVNTPKNKSGASDVVHEVDN